MGLQDFGSFAAEISKSIQQKMGEGYTVSVNDVIKDNGIKLTGITITDGKHNISLVIYIDKIYEKHRDGGMAFPEAVSEIMDIYGESRPRGNFNMAGILNYVGIRERIKGRLINTAKNKEYLKGVPHRGFLDLSLVYMVTSEADTDGSSGVITVNNPLMKTWGVTEDMLFGDMKMNMEASDDAEISDMRDIIRRLKEEDSLDSVTAPEPDMPPVPMYVIGSRSRANGAVRMMDGGILKRASEMLGGDFIILPSSRHEVIAVPVAESEDELERMAETVKEINRTEVEETDFLSDHVYRYDSSTGKVSIAA